jgi:hypothetical protein
MTEVHFIFKIGPIPGSDGDINAYFVYPPKDDTPAFFADADGEGLKQVLARYGAASLECEPELAPAAAEFGIRPGELTPLRAFGLGTIAFEMAFGDYVGGIKRQGILYQFGLACAAFWRGSPWRYLSSQQVLDVTLQGARNDSLAGVVMGGDDRYGLALYKDLEDLRRVTELFREGRLEEAGRIDSFCMSLDDQPAFATDAMRRAFGLPRLPIPTRMKDGQGPPLDDLDLLTIATAVSAVSRITAGVSAATSCITVDDLEIEAVVRVR